MSPHSSLCSVLSLKNKIITKCLASECQCLQFNFYIFKSMYLFSVSQFRQKSHMKSIWVYKHFYMVIFLSFSFRTNMHRSTLKQWLQWYLLRGRMCHVAKCVCLCLLPGEHMASGSTI